MQTYDMLMILVLVAATLFGFWKGMAWQIASLASLVLSYFAALQICRPTGPDDLEPRALEQVCRDVGDLHRHVVCDLDLFRLVSGAIDRVKLDSFDHQMGALFGFAKGVLVCIAITFFAVTILPQAQKDTIIASRTGEYIIVLLDKTHAIVPPEVHDVIHPYVERIEQRLDPNHQPSPGREFQALWPEGESAPSTPPTWPSHAASAPGWPSAEPSDVAPSAWSHPDQPIQPSATEQPLWPSQPQTADRPQETRSQGTAY